jgi:hypothetical protein
MNVSWATPTFAQQISLHIAEAGTAKSGPSVNTYEEGLRHKYAKVCRMMVNAETTTPVSKGNAGCPLRVITEMSACCSKADVSRSSIARLPSRLPRGATADGEPTEVKPGGFSAPTQDVSGAAGSARNDTTTAWALGDWEETACPMPGMPMMVALDSLAAAAFARPATSAYRSCRRRRASGCCS